MRYNKIKEIEAQDEYSEDECCFVNFVLDNEKLRYSSTDFMLLYLQNQIDTNVDNIFGEEIERFIWAEDVFKYGLSDFKNLDILDFENEEKTAIDIKYSYKKILDLIGNFYEYNHLGIVHRKFNDDEYLTFLLDGEYDGLGLTLAKYNNSYSGDGFICYLHNLKNVYKDYDCSILKDRKTNKKIGEYEYVSVLNIYTEHGEGIAREFEIKTHDSNVYSFGATSDDDGYETTAYIKKDFKSTYFRQFD